MRTRTARSFLLACAVVASLAQSSAGQVEPANGCPQVTGSLPVVEEDLLQTLKTAHLCGRLIRIAGDTNGHLTIAWVVFVSPASVPGALPELQAYAWDVVRTTFAAVRTLDELHLTGIHQRATPFEVGHDDVAFSAAVSREEFLRVPRGTLASEAVHLLARLWYHPSLVLAPDRSGNADSQARLSDPVVRRTVSRRAWARPGQHLMAPRHPDAERGQGRPVGAVIYRGNPSRRMVAITFDDGPFPIYTTLLLDTLHRLGLQATFFLVGEQVQQYPYFARAIVRAGHEVGNHTFHHASLTHVSPEKAVEEIVQAQEVIAEVTGQTPSYFRPPGGDYNRVVLRTVRRLGLTSVFWTANSGDYTLLGRKVLQARILARVNNGGILLFHQGVANTIWVLPQMTEVLRRRGYTITHVSGLFAGIAPGDARR